MLSIFWIHQSEEKKMVDNNYHMAARHYSYSVLRSQLTAAIKMFFGDEVEPLMAGEPESKSEDYLNIDSRMVGYKRYDSSACLARTQESDHAL